jgi:peptide deformylase
MAVLNVVLYPHEALVKPALPVTEFDAALHRFIEDMAETMYASSGVGLAANQVAVLKRVTVIDCAPEGEPAQLLEIVNPTIVFRDGQISWNEGCLSFPDLYNEVKRSETVRVTYQDRHGAAKEIEASGLLGVCLQHEIDHLDGVLFIDRISQLERRLALKRYRRILEKRKSE